MALPNQKLVDPEKEKYGSMLRALQAKNSSISDEKRRIFLNTYTSQASRQKRYRRKREQMLRQQSLPGVPVDPI
jgi:hypothetical protein